MLSFLRDSNAGELPADKAGDEAGKPPAEGSEKPQDQEYVAVAAQGSSVRKGTMLIAILFVAGMVCLWLMIRRSSPQSASAAQGQTEQAKIEAAITRMTGVKSEMFSRMDEIVNKFYEFSEVPQVEVVELVKNPFELETFLASLRQKIDSSEADLSVSAELMRRQRIKEQIKGKQLMTIMKTEEGKCCMISNKFLYEGDVMEDFKVTEIGDSFVRLTWVGKSGSGAGAEGDEFVLKLSE